MVIILNPSAGSVSIVNAGDNNTFNTNVVIVKTSNTEAKQKPSTR
ncbi:TPA: hypothetical protein ACKO9N_001429 [Listeria monocytogenes]